MKDFAFEIPPGLKRLESSAAGREWLARLPACVSACADHWSLQLGPPYKGSQVSIVFPVTFQDGPAAVLKLQFPHSESEYEADALRLWNGQGAVRLFAHEPAHHALLMEKCEPGHPLSGVGAEEAIAILTGLLPRLWIPVRQPFKSLAEEAAGWAEELPQLWERAERPFAIELLSEAVEGIHYLCQTPGEQVLLNQDLHGDNVLRAQREPWLVIDPKPLAGEREFGVAPIVRSYEFGHSREAVIKRLNTLTDALGLDRERARLWTVAQALAWAFAGERILEAHLQTALWLWRV